MAMGRPPKGPALVDGLAGDAEDKRRLRVMLETINGTRTVDHACAQLNVSRTRFFQLRDQALEGALSGLEREKPGRKPKQEEPDKVRELQS